MRSAGVVVSACVLALVLGCNSDAAASVEVPAALDLGDREAGKNEDFWIEVRNRGSRPMAIRAVRASCSCVTFPDPLPTIAANGTARVRASIEWPKPPMQEVSVRLEFEEGARVVRVRWRSGSLYWDIPNVFREGIERDRRLQRVAAIVSAGTREELIALRETAETDPELGVTLVWEDPRPLSGSAGHACQLSLDVHGEQRVRVGSITIGDARLPVGLVLAR
jgi:hypothetical protein